MRLIGVLAYTAVFLGIIMLGMRRSEPAEQSVRPLPELPDDLVAHVLEAEPAKRFVVVMTDASCGSPFRTALNYLHHLDSRDFAIVTGSQDRAAFRMLEGREGIPVRVDDGLIARTLPFGNLILIERRGPLRSQTSDGPLVYQFESATTDVMVQALNEVFGVDQMRSITPPVPHGVSAGRPSRDASPGLPEPIQQNLQRVLASSAT